MPRDSQTYDRDEFIPPSRRQVARARALGLSFDVSSISRYELSVLIRVEIIVQSGVRVGDYFELTSRGERRVGRVRRINERGPIIVTIEFPDGTRAVTRTLDELLDTSKVIKVSP